MNRTNVGFVQIILASFLFGFVPVVVKYLSSVDVYSIAFYRILFSVVLLLFFFLSSKNRLAPFKFERGKLTLFGFLHGFIIIGYFIAIRFTSIATAVLLVYSSSLWIVIFSSFILHEKINRASFFALLLGLFGLFLVSSPSFSAGGLSLLGMIAGLLAGIGFALVYTLSKTFKHYDKISLTFWQNLISLPFVLLFFLFNFSSFPAPIDWVYLLFLAGLFTTIPFILVYKGFDKVPAHKGGILMLLDIIFPLLFALLLFSEVPSIKVSIGALLIIISSYLATRE
jgi:drug/metabolite transporter (DMT)-like permease